MSTHDKLYDVRLASNPNIHQILDIRTIVLFQAWLCDLSTNVGIACLTHEYANRFVGPSTQVGIDWAYEGSEQTVSVKHPSTQQQP
jgi:hypothetical protein